MSHVACRNYALELVIHRYLRLLSLVAGPYLLDYPSLPVWSNPIPLQVPLIFSWWHTHYQRESKNPAYCALA